MTIRYKGQAEEDERVRNDVPECRYAECPVTQKLQTNTTNLQKKKNRDSV
jgi:hypothetical protein